MGWRERYDTTDSGQRDGAVNEDRTVLFFVDVPAAMAFDPSQTVGTGFTAPLPRGTLHPRIAGLYIDDFRIVKQTSDSCEVEALYTTEAAAWHGGGWPAGSLAIQRTAHKREASFRKATTKVPIIRETRGKLLMAATGSPTRPSYEVDFITVEETQPVLQISVTLPALTDTMIQQIDAQDGALHKIGSGPYVRPARFEAGDVVQHGPSKWRVLYTWYTDKGTRAGKMSAQGKPDLQGTTTGEPSGLQNPAVYGTGENEVKQYRPPTNPNMLQAPAPGVSLPYGDTALYIRSPFHELHYILHTDLVPEFVQFCPFRVENNPPTPPGFAGVNNGLGWQLLPGGPVP